MAVNPTELKTEYDAHVNTTNPHKVASTQIWGLYNVDNTSDTDKPVSTALQKALDKKVNISDIYNSTEDSTEIDLTTVPLSAMQGYIMADYVNTYSSGDTTELEARIAACEEAVGIA